jgi:hypothetical protein
LPVAIAYRAIQNDFDAAFGTATALIDDLSTAPQGATRHALPTEPPPGVLVRDEGPIYPGGRRAAPLPANVNRLVAPSGP